MLKSGDPDSGDLQALGRTNSRPLKTLVYSSLPPQKCGIGAYAAEHVLALKAAGHRVYSCSFDGISAANFQIDLYSKKSILKAILWLMFERFDSIFVHYTADFFFPPADGLSPSRRQSLRLFQSFWLIALALFSGKTGTIIFHEAYPGLTQSRILLLLRGFAFGRFGRLEFHTTTEMDRMVKAFPRLIQRSRCEVVKHERYMTSKFTGGMLEARQQLQLPQDETIFLCIGFIQEHKGFHLAAEAVQETFLSDSSVCLYIVGSVRTPVPEYLAYRDRLKAQVAAYSRVKLIERFVDDEEFDRWLMACNAVILPYKEISSSGVAARAILFDKQLFLNSETNLKDQLASYPYAAGFSGKNELKNALKDFRPRQLTESTGLHSQSPKDELLSKPILFIMPWFGPKVHGGAETFIFDLCRELVKLGVPIEVWTTDSTSVDARNHGFRQNSDDDQSGLKIRRFPANVMSQKIFAKAHPRVSQSKGTSRIWGVLWKYSSLYGRGMERALKQRADEFGSIHLCHYFGGTTHRLAGLYPKKTILHPFIHDEPALYHPVMRDLFAGIRGVICNTEAEMLLASKAQTGLLPQLFKPIGNSVSLLDQASSDVNPYRRRKKEILYIGRLIEEKNIFQLIDWLDAYNSQTEDKLQLILMGDGPLRQHPRVESNSYIHCTGRVSDDEKKAFLTDLLALIQPSRLESFSLVTLEAWSVKTPAIVHADCPATKELVTLSRGGIAIRSPQEFIETIDTLWNDHYLAGYLGESGFQFAQENYRWDMIANRFLEARASIMGYPNHYRKPASTNLDTQTILDLPSTPKQIGPLHALNGRVLRPRPGSVTQRFNRYLGHDFYARFEAFFRDPTTPIKAMPSWAYYSTLAEQMKSDQIWVDIGAGRGHFLDFLLQHGVSHHQLFGVEPDPGSYVEIRQKPYASCSMLADAFLMQLEDESLDVISMLHVAEHIPWEDLCVIIAMAYKKLRKGGRIIVEVPNINTIKTAATNFWLDPTHIRPLVRETLVFLLLHCHFMEVETHTYASHLSDDRMEQLKATLGDPLIVDEIYGHQDLCVTGIKI